MIIKQRGIPITIQKYRAILRRIRSDHPKVPLIKESYAKVSAGYKGENSLDYPLSFLPEKKYHILNDIRLQDHTNFFQMDALLLSRNYLLTLEVKNYLGHLHFDHTYRQMIRIQNGVEETFPYPLDQTQRHEKQLKNWLITNKLPDVPLHSLVIISSPYTKIGSSPENHPLQEKVVRKDYLPTKIAQLEKTYNQLIISEKQLKRISQILNSQHVPADFSILDKYHLSKDDLVVGAHCQYCDYLPLERWYNSWYCPRCNVKIKDAHLASLKDYYLLIDSRITNTQFRDFLQIDSPALATRILKAMNLQYEGTFKNRVYLLSFDD